MPIIILEGCDCVGKSTLAEALSAHTGYEIVKGSSFEIAEQGTDAMYEHMKGLLDRNNIIIDRFYLSNFVYGNLFSYPTMNTYQFVSLALIAEQRALTVYVTADKDEIIRRMKKRGDEVIQEKEIESILDKYEQGLRDRRVCQSVVLHLNSTFANLTDSVHMIQEFADMPERKIYSHKSV